MTVPFPDAERLLSYEKQQQRAKDGIRSIAGIPHPRDYGWTIDQIEWNRTGNGWTADLRWVDDQHVIGTLTHRDFTDSELAWLHLYQAGVTNLSYDEWYAEAQR